MYALPLSHPAPLPQDGRVAVHFKKLATQKFSTALSATILSQSSTVETLDDIKNLIEKNLELSSATSRFSSVTSKWHEEVVTGIEELIATQFSHLMWDLTHGKRKGKSGDGLLKGLLQAFLLHIVQTARLQVCTLIEMYACMYLSIYLSIYVCICVEAAISRAERPGPRERARAQDQALVKPHRPAVPGMAPCVTLNRTPNGHLFLVKEHTSHVPATLIAPRLLYRLGPS